MKKSLCFLILLLSFVVPIFADDFDNVDNVYNDSNEQLAKAVDYYELGNYNNAIKIYETLLENDIRNSTVYYNLAVLYLKNKEIGKARLNLERALKLSPRDKDVRILKEYLSQITEEPKQNIAERFISDIKLVFSLNEITLIMFMLFLFGSAFFIAYCLVYKKLYISLSVIFFICFLLFIPLIYMKIDDEILSTKAVVMEYAEVRNNPIKLEEPSFDILEGRKVIVLSKLGRWVNVKLEIEGLSGWVDRHLLENI